MCYVYVNVCMCMCMFFPVGFCFRARDAAEYYLEYWYFYANYYSNSLHCVGRLWTGMLHALGWCVVCCGLGPVCCIDWCVVFC